MSKSRGENVELSIAFIARGATAIQVPFRDDLSTTMTNAARQREYSATIIAGTVARGRALVRDAGDDRRGNLMKKLSIFMAGAALIAFTGLASAQAPSQTPAVSPSQTQQKPGGADGGLQPDQTKKPGEAGMNQSAPKAGTTGSGGVMTPPVKGSDTAAPSGGAQGGSASAPSVKPNEPTRSNP
jgi:hypothetical protein